MEHDYEQMKDRYEIEFKEGGAGFIENVATFGAATVIEKGLDAVMGGGHGWDCIIRDKVTGIKASRWGATKEEAQEATFRTLNTEVESYQRGLEKEKERKESEYQEQLRQQRQSRETKPAETGDSAIIQLLIKFAIILGIIAIIVWLIFAVAIPLVIINISTIALIIGLSYKKWNRYIFPISLLGTIYIVADFNIGWLTVILVQNASFFENLIPIFFYLNIIAGLVAAYFFIRNLLNNKIEPIKGKIEFSKQNLKIIGTLFSIGFLTVGLQTYFNEKDSLGVFGVGKQKYIIDNKSWKTAQKTNTIISYQKYITDFPNGVYLANAYDNIGTKRLLSSDLEGAILEYNNAIQINPKFPNSYNNRGEAKQYLNDQEGAWSDYNKAILLNPKYSDAYNNRSIIKFNRGDYHGAIQDCNLSIKFKKDNPNAYNNRAGSKISLKDYAGAMKDYDMAIKLNPTYSDGFKNRGIAKYYQKDLNGACIDWKKASEFGNQSASQLIQTYCK